MHVSEVENDFHRLTSAYRLTRFHPRNELGITGQQIDKLLGAEWLDDVDLDLHRALGRHVLNGCSVDNVLRSKPEDDVLSELGDESLRLVGGDSNLEGAAV